MEVMIMNYVTYRFCMIWNRSRIRVECCVCLQICRVWWLWEETAPDLCASLGCHLAKWVCIMSSWYRIQPCM